MNSKPALRCVALASLIAGAAGLAAAVHEHGVAHLDAAVEGESLEIRLSGPGDSFVGFEHAPVKDSEQAAVARAVQQLGSAATWLVTTESAQCRQVEASVSPHFGVAENSHRAVSESREGAAHAGDKPLAKEHDAHQGEAHNEDEHGGSKTHSEWSVYVRMRCSGPASLVALQVKLFSSFPGLGVLQVQVVTPTTQFGAELTPAQTTLALQPSK